MTDHLDEPTPNAADSEAATHWGAEANRCGSCGTPELADDTDLCGRCADEAWDRWLDRHDDVGADG